MPNFNSHHFLDQHQNRTSVFDLSCSRDYELWRNAKLALLPVDADALKVEITNPYTLHENEIAAITQRCATYGVAIYQLREPPHNDKSWLPEFGRQLGLVSLDDNLRSDEDSVSSLQVRSQQGNQYIPYTNRPLSWHTDGYYNAPEKQIRTIIMHCASPAASGGVNSLLDHEQLYIALRERNPAWIEALMHPQAMTIPANVEAGVEIRQARTGPVFSVDKASGNLHMRYSARKRNIEWRDDAPTREAVEFISEKLADEAVALKYQLDAGQGIICNNILHNRSGFEDSDRQQRLMYRARYYEQVAGLIPLQNA
ncbi:MAG: TauD/TfdA family dioxygenase [Gammaproteobacteria bacterium]|jgi:alpha-ketoglutarate-dependent taurine dioxygenase|nr:TauD/TfdA family dioxygenase [Gammaproteobacteria bacterium]